ncbi:carbon storage regulator CsrA [Cellulomonas sp. JZ18]|uniref:carbon storage regulator CsrA n=1 Tax=Cellulomonas sp. JZ18 TaxID=2654191 RepID=UPI0018AFB942|nr:carbon storage regulator CsrA [Cellulomonas sp. JZ18]
MLVLTRRAGERLVIGDDVVITVIEVRSDGVRLGIEAPRHVRVHRAEVLAAVGEANARAAAADAAAEESLRGLVPPRGTRGPAPASGGAAPAGPAPADPAPADPARADAAGADVARHDEGEGTAPSR